MAKELRIRRIFVDQRSWRRPRCSAKVCDQTAYYRAHAGRDDICERKARYEVDGRQLCKLHAGDAALAILLGDA